MQPRRTRLRAMAGCALGVLALTIAALQGALAQDVPREAPPDAVIKVLVTGTNIPGTDRETAFPVQIITRDEIDRADIQTAAQLVNTISANVGFGSWGENLAFAGAATPGLAGAGLRGLTFQRTLVLVNGRRVANYAFTASATDLNLIPLAAVERVEVLKDGASAIYGSDALGGVINFILRREFSGLLANAQYSAPEQPGGWSTQLDATMGYGDLATQQFNVYATIAYQKFGALAARDREFSKSFYIPGQFDQTSSVSFPANVRIGNTLVNPTGNPAAGYANPSCAPPMSFPTVSQPNQCRFDAAYFLDALNASERFSTAIGLRWQWTPDHQFYADGFYSRNDFTFVASPTSFQNRFLLPASSPYYPHDFAKYFKVDGQPLNAQWRSVELGGRTSQPVVGQWNAVAGLRGTLAGWSYDAGLSFGVNDNDDRYTSGYLLSSAILPLLASGVVDPFGYNTPEVVAKMAAAQVNGTVRTGRSSLVVGDFRASREVYDLPAGPLSVAFGAEARRWKVATTVSKDAAAGEIVGVGFSPAYSASRDNYAVFGEANAPLAAGFEANLAVRYDSYSDVGSTTNPKIALRWQPVRPLLFRASAGTGFRAPGLVGLYEPPSFGTSGAISDPARCPTTQSARDCNANFPTVGGGNPDLQSETSSQWGVGVVWSPIASLTLAVDYFDIIVDNLIFSLNPTVIFSLCPDGVNGPTCKFVKRGPVDPQYPTLPGPVQLIRAQLSNIGTVRTAGLDLDIRYQTPRLDWGQLQLSLQATYLTKYLQQQTDGRYASYLNHEIQAPLLGPVPFWKHYLTIGWNYGPWSATLTENFQRGTWDVFPPPGQTLLRKIGNYDVWNLSGSYAAFRDWQFSLGVKNLADRNPPFTNQNFTAGNGAPGGYDPTYTDPRGRLWWAAARYRFK